MSEGFELEVSRQALNGAALGCSQSSGLQGYTPGYQQSLLGITPYCVQNCTCPSSPGDYEIWIQQIGDGEPLLNYGPKLRLIMADPFKGIDLREAIAKLKSALKQCKI